MAAVILQELNGTPLVQNVRGFPVIFEAATPFFDPTPPVVTVITQPPIYRQTPVIIEVMDPRGNSALFLVEIFLVNADASNTVIYDGDKFVQPFSGSNYIVLSDRLQFQLMKRDGWFTAPQFRIRAVNRALVSA